MLQQTQVKTVIPYWKRWMRELPDVESVAGASPETLRKLWEGLGYYTRVHNLQQAAQVILKQHAGRFPDQFEDVLALPGIGRYTAGAICSIAFHQPTPALDGNGIRVLTRVFGIRENPKERSTNQRLWGLAQELVRSAECKGQNDGWTASHFNQALMEFGAMICTPRQPKCTLCPVSKHCLALRDNLVAKLPNLGRRTPPTRRRCVAFVVYHRRRFLLVQRPAGVVNAHFWEFPNTETDGTGSDLKALARRLFDTTPAQLEKLCVVKHSITRYRITLEAYRAKFNRQPARGGSRRRWLPLAALQRVPLAAAHRKILNRLQPDIRQPRKPPIAR